MATNPITALEIEQRESLGVRPGPRPEQILLPFAEKEYISTKRVMHILGIDKNTVTRLAASGRIEWINYRKYAYKRIRYQSLVDFCDRLRRQHKIADRRRPLSAPYLRHRDEDLLPFPLSDTVSSEQACAALGYSALSPLVTLIEEGHFEAYQLVQQGLWRISRSSLSAFIQRSRGSGSAGSSNPLRGAPYKTSPVSPHF